MGSPELSQFHASSMAKVGNARNKTSLCLTDGCLCLGGVFLAVLLVGSFFSFYSPNPNFEPAVTQSKSADSKSPDCFGQGVNLREEPPDETFYDDPGLSYSIEQRVKNWDEKREQWLKNHPSFAVGARERVLMVTGSQSSACKNPVGDHLLLRSFKNKVDYCRIHGIDIFYNNALLQPKMGSYWAKLPVVRAAMMAHPEAEWIWWVDSDAFFTDMEFELPLHRYRSHNLVVHGWEKLIYEKMSWTSLNAGVFLIRNCQWSMDLIDVWANMGPMSPEYDEWGRVLRTTFKDKLFPESDDQSAMIYLLYKEKEKYADKIYLEGEYYFEGYWFEVIDTYANVTERYLEMERQDRVLRRRHAEKVSEWYGAYREQHHLKGERGGKGSRRRPFITHFTGCQPCSGNHNQMYTGDSCVKGMIKALNFADNQVMRKYGFVHSDLLKTSPVSPLPFDYPDDGPW